MLSEKEIDNHNLYNIPVSYMYSETSDSSTLWCFQDSNIPISNAETGFVLWAFPF